MPFRVESASPHEVTLVEQTLATTFVGALPERLFAWLSGRGRLARPGDLS